MNNAFLWQQSYEKKILISWRVCNLKLKSWKFRVSNNFMHKRGISLFSVENFFSQCRKISWGTLQCFIKLRVSKTFMLKKGISLFSVGSFLSHSAEKYRGGTLHCFIKLGPTLLLQNSVVLPTVPWEPLEWSFWQMSVKSISHLARLRLEPGPNAWEPCCPNPLLSFIFG